MNKDIERKMAVCWVVAPCSLVEVYWRFRSAFYFHLQSDPSVSSFKTSAVSTRLHGATSQKTAIFIIVVERT
jgi:hypothetical protein